MIGFTRPSVQTELDRFYKSLSRGSSFESVSKSAFTQARKKLSYTAFIELYQSQLAFFNEQAHNKKVWKGKRVVAIDGSLLNLPDNQELRDRFGTVNNQYEKIASARISFAYDVGNDLVLDAIIAPMNRSETDLAVEHLAQLNPKTDILVFDRGYPSQWLIGLLMKKGFKFCFRLSSCWKSAYQALEGNEDIDWSLVRNSKKDSDRLKSYCIPTTLKGLRLVSIPLNSGVKEVLITNLLDREVYPVTILKELYQMRWGVEESYKTFKKMIHIEHFTGKSELAIKQDFYARVFMLNMASMIRSQGVKQGDRKTKNKYTTQINKTQVLAKTKDFLVDLFYFKNRKKLVKQLIGIIEKRKDIIRPNRSFPRKKADNRRRLKTSNHKGF